MRRSIIWLVLTGAFLVAGCATQAQRQYQAIATGNKAIVAEAKACLTEIYNDPEAAPLRIHIPFDPRDATLTQLSDPALATPPEIDAIKTVHPRIQSCRKAALNRLVNTMPGIVPILAKEYGAADDDIILLIQRKISWGEVTRRARDRAVATQAAIETEAQRVVAGLERENEAELARRRAAAQAVAQWAQTQQLINAMNRPVITNCNQFGNMVNCRSQ